MIRVLCTKVQPNFRCFCGKICKRKRKKIGDSRLFENCVVFALFLLFGRPVDALSNIHDSEQQNLQNSSLFTTGPGREWAGSD
jgi:hypothetical protein